MSNMNRGGSSGPGTTGELANKNFITRTISQLPAQFRNSNGIGLNSRRRKLSLTFIPPSTKSPLFIYNGNEDQRSFLSLGSRLESERESLANDNESVSTFRSLPSTLEVSPEPDSMTWLMEEHHRRFSSINEDDEDDEDDVIQQVEERYRFEQDSDMDDDSDRDVLKHLTRDPIRPRSRHASMVSQPLGDIDEDFAFELTTPRSEFIKTAKYSVPLVITFLLEQLFSVVCVLVVGHLGTSELAAVSLASMTSTIIFAIFEGCATSLDTLCPQAYGAGNYHAVGVHFQRCCSFSLILFIPFGFFWYYSSFFLKYVIEDEEVVKLTELFLRWLIPGAPAYIIFECGKRFLQLQSIFEAGTIILFITAPLNVVCSYLLVWNPTIGLGYIGAPIAASLNFWLMLIMMLLYVVFIDGSKCWGGFTKEAFTHYYDLSKFAIPGIIMLEAEYLAYEILTLLASYLGTNALAAQSLLSTIASLTYMMPFAVGIASSTRIANFIGGENAASAKVATKIGLCCALIVGFFNCSILLTFRTPIAKLFTSDEDLIDLITAVFPLVAFIQVFDGLSSVASGILRAQGLQEIGGIVNLVSYYLIAIPLSLLLAFHFHWRLYGLWAGLGIGMFIIGFTESTFILTLNWDKVVETAKLRNESHDVEENV